MSAVTVLAADLTEAEVEQALSTARHLVHVGVPVFVAKADPDSPTGFRLPSRWQFTVPKPSTVDAWRPGDALCAVMGVIVDGLDIDPRHGGDATENGLRAAGMWPTSYGVAETPSGGRHYLVARLKTGSRDNVRPGFDVKGGRDGLIEQAGRGFLFIAPTVRFSKTTGELRAYRWTEAPDFEEIEEGDDSGAALAQVVRDAIGSRLAPSPVPTGPHAATPEVLARVGELAAELARAEEGAGNVTAARLAFMAGGYVGAGQIGLDLAEAILVEGLAGWTYRDARGEAAMHATVRAQLVKGAQSPRPWTAAPASAGLAEATFGATALAQAAVPAAVPLPRLQVVEAPDNHERAFWASRPELAHLHDFARARRASPWAVLGAALTRVVASVPPFVVLPPLTGGDASLNLFVGLVGPSGAGKGAAIAAASDAVLGPLVETFTPGSGEGLAKLFVTRSKGGDDKGELVKIRSSVILRADEVDTLTALGQRQGATLLPQLRSAWSGEGLGFAYADPEKAIKVEPHEYRLTVIVGIQPARAGGLLDDVDGGTPQRFLWLPTLDPDAPDEAPECPTPITWRRPRPWYGDTAGRVRMPIPDVARQIIDEARRERLRGEGEALDGHALLCRLKTAAALALLCGRDHVTDDDWSLAGIVQAVSDRTRAAVVAHLARDAERRNEARGQSEGKRVVIVEETKREHDLARTCRLIVKHLSTKGDMKLGKVREAMARPDREYLGEALERLQAAGQVEVTDPDERYPSIRLVGRAS